MKHSTPKWLGILLIVGAVSLSGILVWGPQFTGFGTGRDIVSMIQDGTISSNEISSIEFFGARRGGWPFTAQEYAKLPKIRQLTDLSTVGRVLDAFRDTAPGRVHLNHPSTDNRMYIKVNIGVDYYWVYVYAIRDANRVVLMLEANRRNALNPNGAKLYHVGESAADLMSIMQGVQK